MDVDHIIPRTRGGKTVRPNLQAMCAKCNRAKGNRDTTDYRNSIPPERDPSCVFCSDELKIEQENGTAVAILDKHPVTPGHHLIIPRRHAVDYFAMTVLERQHAEELMRVLRNRLTESDSSIAGFNIGMNCGEMAGQTVMRAHIHLIPRRKGDVADPGGGVRGVVPGKMSY